MSEVQDGFNIGLKGHLLIRDPETGQVILDRPSKKEAN
jgi:hypothetical protein